MVEPFVKADVVRSYPVFFATVEALDAGGIEYVLGEDHDSTDIEGGRLTKGGSVFLVPESKVDEVRRIIASIRKSLVDDKRGDEETESDSKCLACGREMPEGVSVCSSCGWTFDVDESP